MQEGSTVNRLGGLRLPRKSVAGLTDRPDMTIDFTVDVKQQYNLKERPPLVIKSSYYISDAIFSNFWGEIKMVFFLGKIFLSVEKIILFKSYNAP